MTPSALTKQEDRLFDALVSNPHDRTFKRRLYRDGVPRPDIYLKQGRPLMKTMVGLLMLIALAVAPGKATVLRAEYGGVSSTANGTVPPRFVVAVVQFDNDKELRRLQVGTFTVFDATGTEKPALRLVSIERFDRPRIATEGESAYYLNQGGTTPWDGILPKGTIRLRVKMEIPHDILPKRFRFTLGPYTVAGQICCSWPT